MAQHIILGNIGVLAIKIVISAKKKKVLFLINSLSIGGAEKVFVSQANALLDKDFEVYFGILNNYIKDNYLCELKIARHNFINFNNMNFLDIKLYRKLYSFLASEHIGYIYATLAPATIMARVIKLFLPGVKVIVREACTAEIKALKQKIFDLITYPLIYRIIAVSELVRRSLEKYFFFHPQKIVVINNGIELPPPPDRKKIAQIKKKYQLNGRYVVLHVGRMGKDTMGQKGHIYLIQASGRWPKQKSGWATTK